MTMIMFLLLSAPFVLVACRNYIQMPIAFVITFFYLIFSMGLSAYLMTKVEPLFRKLLSEK